LATSAKVAKASGQKVAHRDPNPVEAFIKRDFFKVLRSKKHHLIY